MERIGIFGGSFDPVHNEHINLARAALRELNLDKLFVLPASLAPHKEKGSAADGLHRLNMLKIAFDDDEKIIAHGFEINSGGKSYTYDTVKYFSQSYPDSKIYLIMGADMLIDFPTWKRAREILEFAEIAAAERADQTKNKALLTFAAFYPPGARFIKYRGANVSSTDLRYMLYARSHSAQGYTPAAVHGYIIENNLYTDALCKEVYSRLTERRYAHTVRTAELAIRAAKAFNQDKEKAFYAAMLHDIDKDLANVKSAGFPPDMPKAVMHAFSGAQTAEDLGVADTDILNSIKYHTTGRAGMSGLEKLIFVCDTLEEGRDFEGLQSLRALLFKDPEQCFQNCLKMQYTHLKLKKAPVYYLTKQAYEYYCKNQGDN